ncbi:MAG TPA: clostripain-related cysteine peptidase [Pyrinomonadaceae bacterium]|jgi:hypothetical protein
MLSPETDRKVTVMCYFGSDNALSPLLISQVKAIKDAGYEDHTDVLVRFDPNEPSAPTRVYHVNAKRRALATPDENGERSLIGDGNNPFVRNMAEDIIDPDRIEESTSRPFSNAMRKELKNGENLSATDSLRNFIGYSLENYPADHYILFLIGHGMIVGNDAFLPDDNPNTGISLVQLADILREFNKSDGKLELVGLHSCSMSSVEIAYQLKGIANYVMASQGTSFVGSWPYRQLLKKIFATVHDAFDTSRSTGNPPAIDIQQLVEKLYSLSLYNSTDFMLAGYCADMTLCNLRPDLVDGLTTSLRTLINLLTDATGTIPTDGKGISTVAQNGNKDPIKDLIVSLIGKAHAESQSFWGESYTDLYDFCDCLQTACQSVNKAVANEALTGLVSACAAVKGKLGTVASGDRAERFNSLVVRQEFFGWKYQYSHGLSIYFPWAEPLEVENVTETPVTIERRPGQKSVAAEGTPAARSIMERYQDYEFTQVFKKEGLSWFDFLNAYFNSTQRKLRTEDVPAPVLSLFEFAGPGEVATLNTTAATSFLDHKASGEQGSGDNKPVPSIGSDCGCSSIKNFHTKSAGNGRRIKAFSISAGALRAFKEPEQQPAGAGAAQKAYAD